MSATTAHTILSGKFLRGVFRAGSGIAKTDTVIRDSLTPETQLIVTGGKAESSRQCKQLLQKVFSHARVRNAGFRFVFVIESAGNPLALAANVEYQHRDFIGHITPVLASIDTTTEAISETAVKIAIQHIGADETFCFRIHKRGSYGLLEDTPTLECKIGGAIWRAIEQKYGRKPSVDLEDPDITVVAEVLGPRTALGISRKTWKQQKIEMPESRAS